MISWHCIKWWSDLYIYKRHKNSIKDSCQKKLRCFLFVIDDGLDNKNNNSLFHLQMLAWSRKWFREQLINWTTPINNLAILHKIAHLSKMNNHLHCHYNRALLLRFAADCCFFLCVREGLFILFVFVWGLQIPRESPSSELFGCS